MGGSGAGGRGGGDHLGCVLGCAAGRTGAVNGVATVVRGGSLGLRRLQSGYVRNYALWLAVGAVLVLAWFLTKAGI